MAGELERRVETGELEIPLDDLPPEERLQVVLDALGDVGAIKRLMQHRADRGVPLQESSQWKHGSSWDPSADEPKSR
ncbi:hypothetical protein [Actinosynnema sp. NPDC023587]|uniref:hypothetical protein n=1 Tax=Actinosynnema sp. NPDC023587 TaxID=3154695 RepID=UPI0033F1CED8